MIADAVESQYRTDTKTQKNLILEVKGRKEEATGVISIELGHLDGSPLPSWTPGAHIDLHVNSMIRQYSLCSAPSDTTHWRIGILNELEGRGGSRYVHENLHIGAKVEVSLPRNNFHLVPSPRYVFVGGGIGITPLVPMVAEAESRGSDWNLVYGGRMRESMAFVDELLTYGERVKLVPEDTDGWVDFQKYFDEIQPDTLIYACGPEPMLAALEKATAHWPTGSLHLERFAAIEFDTSGDTAFEVECVDSDMTLQIPAEKSILEVAGEAGLSVMSSCEEGTCGTCETDVVSGDIEHRDAILTDAEKEESETMFICVSRAQKGCSKLCLEL